MPAFSTHYIFALEMMDKLKKLADFELNENAVFAGAQGPDIFFFHRIFPWQSGKSLRKAGSALHRAKPGDILDGFQKYCKASADTNIATSYVYGFILHYALDRKCHPYIYFLQNKTAEREKIHPASAHNLIELSLDSVMLKTHLGIRHPKSFETESKISLSDIEKAEIAKVLTAVSNLASPFSFNEQDVITALNDTKSAQHLLLDKSGRKAEILTAAEKIAMPFTKNFKISSFLRTDNLEKAEKYVNINNGIWESPFENGKRNESFYDLFELSKADAADMIEKWNRSISGREITNNLSFLTGVETE